MINRINRFLGRFRLQQRLFVGFLLIIGLSQLFVVGYTLLAPFSPIENVPAFFSQQYGVHFTPVFVASYRNNGSWDEAQFIADLIVDNPSQQSLPTGRLGPLEFIDLQNVFSINRIVLLDASDQVVADSDVARSSTEQIEAFTVPIIDDGVQIGALIVESGFDNEFIQVLRMSFRRAFVGISLLAALISAALTWIMSNRLAKPILNLNQAASTLAESGNTALLPVDRSDEIGELTVTFNRMVQNLQHQRHLRQQMVADIAHELRTPLSIMRLELSSVVDGFQEPEVAAAALAQELDALEKLIEDLNLLALSDAKELTLELREIDAADFLTQAVRLWEQPALQQGTQIRLRLTAEDELLIWADERRLYQVLNNLVSNAFRYAPNRPFLDIELVTTPSGMAHFRVRDYGDGIPAGEIPHLFDRFYRVNKHDNNEIGGTGLGLAIAKRLVELHGGRIWCESEVGVGSQFVVELPPAI